MTEASFELAGAEIGWPIGSAPGLSNHPDVEMTAARLDNLLTSGVSFAVAGSLTLGEARGGNGYIKTETGWEYLGGDEYVDVAAGAGYNAKGLPNCGTDLGIASLDDFLDLARQRNVELALSFSPHSGRPLEELAEFIDLAGKALAKGVLYVEFNLSCPNVPDRPPFYKDIEGVLQFHQMLESAKPLVNRHGALGAYEKYGPFEPHEFKPDVHGGHVKNLGGRVTSNTLGNQEPKTETGEPAVTVNNGKAGMSGPALKLLGREQLSYLAEVRANLRKIGSVTVPELIRVLGVDSGQEVKNSLDLGANAVQLGSVLYWPALVGCETPQEVVEQIKQEFMEVAA